MPAKIDYEPNDICVMHLSGLLKQSEFNAGQNTVGNQIDAGTKPRLLAILENFEGWERGTDWNDLDFMLSHGGEIAEDRYCQCSSRCTLGGPCTSAFAGAGIRRAPVKFFLPNELAQARVWLQE